ncbi:MAG: hypothetical protein JWO43_15 [Candidatus Adlerbacteria bacterium]|nr:hypothetical protein [Candidatus Adlerbacteria bacterium]
MIVSAALLAAVGWWGGASAFFLAFLVSVLETSLSFDNAVINATVLQKMSPKWQQRFLTWGMLIAVVGTRVVLPAIIVAVAAGMSPWIVAQLALYNPIEYSHLLEQSRITIEAFGGAFLLMVTLRYFFNEAKEVHWIRFIERPLARLGQMYAFEAAVALIVLLICDSLVEGGNVLGAGVIGIVLYTLMDGLTGVLDSSAHNVAKAGFALFAYLNLLDAAFSLDGVIGAFALTTLLPVIVVGLGIGAYFVRTFTVYFVRQGTLDTLIYLEHGAYWAIGALSVCMFVGLFHEVPEVFTGVVSIVFIASAYVSSMVVRRRGNKVLS